MASWTEIPNSSLESGAPIRAVDGVAFRDNPIAIAEGATGAPRIQTAGINDEAVTYAKLKKLTAGTAYKIWNFDGTYGGSVKEWVTIKEAQVTIGGTITASFNIVNADSDGCGIGRVLKNGISTGNQTKCGSGSQTFYINIAVAPGDVLTFQFYDDDIDNSFSMRYISVYSGESFYFGIRDY